MKYYIMYSPRINYMMLVSESNLNFDFYDINERGYKSFIKYQTKKLKNGIKCIGPDLKTKQLFFLIGEFN